MKFSSKAIRQLAAEAQGDTMKASALIQMVRRGRELLSANPRSMAWRQIGDAAVVAAIHGDLPAVKSLVSAGIAPDEVLPFFAWPTTLLHSAMSREGIHVLQFLVSLRPNLEVLDGRGEVPLHQALHCAPPKFEQAEILAQAGANLDIDTTPVSGLWGNNAARAFFDSLRCLQAPKSPPAEAPLSGMWHANGLAAQFRLIGGKANFNGNYRVLTASGEHWAPGDELVWGSQ